jgi:GTP cyclohydrolase II
MRDHQIDLPAVSRTRIVTEFGELGFRCFSWGPHEEDNILCATGEPYGQAPLVRVQSACYTAEIFRSLDCDCHAQLEVSLTRVSREGGVVLYMLTDGRGAGLLNKVKALELQRSRNVDTSDAYRELGLPQDPRSYERAGFILKHLGIESVRLLTNNPRKVDGLGSQGLSVVREALEIEATPHSLPYLSAKRDKMGHLLLLGRAAPSSGSK